MSDQKHTGGTWLPARLTFKQLNIIPVGGSFRCQVVGGEDGDARIVATVHGPTERECEANALLIASAPSFSGPVRYQRRPVPDPLNTGWVEVNEEDISHYRRVGQEIRALYVGPLPTAIISKDNSNA